MSNPYESEELRAVCGRTLRPGGLELTRAALELHPFPAGSVLLDLGCGPGGTLEFLSQQGFEPIGVEISPALADEARTHGRVIEADIHDLPLEAHSVDGIFCECVLSLAADQGRVLSECARVLRPGGALIISDIVLAAQADQEVDRSSLAGCLSGAKALAQYIQLLKRAGFTVEQVSDQSRALKELAARLVWHYGSTDILRRLWGGPEDCGCFRARDYGYALIIAGKEDSEK